MEFRAGKTPVVVWSDSVDLVPDMDVAIVAGFVQASITTWEKQPLANCGLGMAFFDEEGRRISLNGKGVCATANVFDSSAWTQVARSCEIPAEARELRAYAVLSVPGIARFDEISISTSDSYLGWERLSTEHYTFRFQANTPITAANAKVNEASMLQRAQVLGVAPPKNRIMYTRYADVAQKMMLTGSSANAHVDAAGNIHSIHATDVHETVHVLTSAWGKPGLRLTSEGLAVAMSPSWHARDPDDWVLEFKRQGSLPQLQALADVQMNVLPDSMISYPVAGSFVRWLMRTYGVASLATFWNRDGSVDSDSQFRLTYGKSLGQLEQEWLGSLEDQ